MKIKYNKRERLEILLESLRDSLFFRHQLADQFEDSGVDFDLLKDDPAFEAVLRIARMYIKDDALLEWWIYESRYDGFSDDEGDFVILNSASELLDYYDIKKHL